MKFSEVSLVLGQTQQRRIIKRFVWLMTVATAAGFIDRLLEAIRGEVRKRSFSRLTA
jgi:hypothetical protein